MDDLISIIVPVYNVENYLEICVESIMNQSYRDIEIILIDDGSTDNSGKICDELSEKDSRIIVIHKENKGVSSARNDGLRLAKGKWISFVDSDDWIEKDFCKILVKTAIKENTEVVMCSHNRVVGNSIEKVNFTVSSKNCGGREYLINCLNPQTGFGFCHMKMYKKEILDGISFMKDLSVGEDALFNEMISDRVKKACLVDMRLYNYRTNSNSVVRKFDPNYPQKYLQAMVASGKLINERHIDDVEVIQNYNNFVAYHVMLIIVNYCCNPESGFSMIDKVRSIKSTCKIEDFCTAIEKSTYENISMTRKITLFTLKKKLYFFAYLIGNARQMSNNIKYKMERRRV